MRYVMTQSTEKAMAKQPDMKHAKEKKLEKKEEEDLKDAIKSLDDEDEKRPGTDDDGTEEK